MKIIVAKCREGWAFLLTKLNAFGSLVMAFALLNPTAMSELIALLPPSLKIPAALALPAAWFLLVQYAKAKAIKAPTVATTVETKV